ncbi:MAG: iron ABC transporter permease [Bdellovibrionales bacterium]|nr:iron ABC transporter permease [Bdellovibrionales bacterium]
MNISKSFFLLFFIFALSVLFFLGVESGPHGPLVSKMFVRSLTDEEYFILFHLRLPRVLLAMGVGAILALSGQAYQTLFMNPLVSPYTLGVSGGAAVGVVFARLFLSHFVPSSFYWIFSLFGGGVVFLLLLPLLNTRTGQAGYGEKVLLLGVLMSLFSGALLYALQYFVDVGGLIELTGWYFGTLNVVGLMVPVITIVLAALFFLMLYSYRSALDLLLFGSEYAISHGIDIRFFYLTILGVSTLALSFVLSVVGPIGYIGLIVPHIARSIVGESHTKSLPVTMCVGSVFLLGCDLVGRTILPTQEIPVGLITALIGCPVMALLLFRR